MLTKSEREWLEQRTNLSEMYCRWCELWHDCHGKWDISYSKWDVTVCSHLFVSKPLLQDALEFSERVAAELAGMMFKPNRYPCRGGFPPLGCMRDWSNLTGPMAVHCEDCILREVRLQVEEEMDNEP